MTPDELLDTLAHDLRTPLNAILGWIGMLRGGQLDAATTRRGLEVVERNARIQAQMIEDVLEVSRLTTGKLHLDIRRLEVVPLLQGVVDAARAAAEAKSIRLRCSFAPDVHAVAGDSVRLPRALGDLLSTAIKLSPAGCAIEVGLQRRDRAAAILVTESKGPIVPGAAEGDPGDREGATSRTPAGLGLALVRRMIELHGGTLQEKSEGGGQAAVFTVLLPEA